MNVHRPIRWLETERRQHATMVVVDAIMNVSMVYVFFREVASLPVYQICKVPSLFLLLCHGKSNVSVSLCSAVITGRDVYSVASTHKCHKVQNIAISNFKRYNINSSKAVTAHIVLYSIHTSITVTTHLYSTSMFQLPTERSW